MNVILHRRQGRLPSLSTAGMSSSTQCTKLEVLVVDAVRPGELFNGGGGDADNGEFDPDDLSFLLAIEEPFN